MARPTVVASGVKLAAPEPELEPEVVEVDDAAPGSVLARMRAQVAEQQRVRTLELPVGGSTTLVIRYRVLSAREWDKYAVLLTPSAARAGEEAGQLPPMSVLNARMMAAACETVLWIDDETGERHDLEARLDSSLARKLAFPLPAGVDYGDLGVLEVVDHLFATPVAVTAHAGELAQWMQDPTVGSAEGNA
jgi:hypothetical protein